tara:strand:+ start:175 stop:1233 length:1059 start_codon:yes stop_codon:yes gene_type:complete
MTIRTAVVGVGAIGGTLGGYMTKSGEDVLLIDDWKEHVDTMNKNGLKLDGITGESIVKVKAVHTDEIPNISGNFDLLVISVKSYKTADITNKLLPYIKDQTWVVSPQNSINELTISPIVGAHRTIGCVTTISAGLNAPGHITRTGSVSQSLQKDPICFMVGELDGTVTDRVKQISEMFSAAGKTITTDDLWGERWSKMVTNCMINATAAMTGLMSHEVRANKEARAQMINLAVETIKVGKSLGYNVKPPMPGFTLENLEDSLEGSGNEKLDAILSGSKPAVPGLPSMAQDVIKGRKTEIEHLNGFVSKTGKEMGIPTPYNDAVVQVIRGIESGQFLVTQKNLRRVNSMISSN